MSRTIFFSWQSDLENKTHRNLIERSIKKAIKNLEKNAEIEVYVNYDRDTLGLMGSPDIASSIFDKIDKSALFVCDISIINKDSEHRKTPNPNVLIELGYACNRLGWERIVCVFDESSGCIDDLPFDLRQKRITGYDAKDTNASKGLTSLLQKNIKDLYVSGKLFNPLNDYMKGRIDKAFLDICKPITNVIFGTFSMSSGLSNTKSMLTLSKSTIEEKITNAHFPAFLVLNTYEQTRNELRDILKDLFSSSYFPKEWAYSVLELINWIRGYGHLTSEGFNTFPFEYKESSLSNNFAVIPATEMNPSNPVNSKMVLELYYKDGKKYVDTEGGKVINTTQYPSYPKKLGEFMVVKTAEIQVLTNCFFDFIKLCKQWLEATDSEFILDPDYYIVNSQVFGGIIEEKTNKHRFLISYRRVISINDIMHRSYQYDRAWIKTLATSETARLLFLSLSGISVLVQTLAPLG